MSSEQKGESSTVRQIAEMEKSQSERKKKNIVKSVCSYSEALRNNLSTKEQLGTTALTYADVCVSKPKTSWSSKTQGFEKYQNRPEQSLFFFFLFKVTSPD